MIFFDFLYYCIYCFYADHTEKGAASTSAGIVGGFQTLNVLTIIMLFKSINSEKRYIEPLALFMLFITFQVFTYYRYIYKKDHSIKVIEEKWLSKSEASIKQINAALFLYGTASIIGCFGLAIYLGSRG